MSFRSSGSEISERVPLSWARSAVTCGLEELEEHHLNQFVGWTLLCCKQSLDNTSGHLRPYFGPRFPVEFPLPWLEDVLCRFTLLSPLLIRHSHAGEETTW